MIVVYYGVNLLSSRAVFQSLALPCRLSSSLHFPIPFFPLLPVSLPLNLALRPNLHPHSLPLALRLISSSLFPSRLHLPPPSFSPSRLHPLPAFQSRPASPLLLLRAILLCSRCSARRKYSLFAPPPLDMAKEAICALLAILEHFFEAFSPLDPFFIPAPFRPAPRPFPASLHPGCRRFPPLPIPFRHRFQPLPSPARPLKSTSSRPGSHPSRRYPPVLSSSSELLSLSLAALHRRAHQAPFCARGLLKNIAVSENAPGAHRDVPRAGGCSTNGRSGDGACR